MEEGEGFSANEAQGKVGQRVRSLVSFSGVPKGTTGTVVRGGRVSHRARDAFNVAVRWNLTLSEPLMDWFSKSEYGRFLREQ